MMILSVVDKNKVEDCGVLQDVKNYLSSKVFAVATGLFQMIQSAMPAEKESLTPVEDDDNLDGEVENEQLKKQIREKYGFATTVFPH